MPDISVIVCTHNPRNDYLSRTLDALARQTLPREKWELVVVDNASDQPLAVSVDLSWHARARHVREDQIGLTPARLRGIAESSAGLLVFVDDDNVLASDYLERAAVIHASYAFLGAFGAGVIDPEFEAKPRDELGSWLSLLALRTIPTIRWSNNASDAGSIPWGAGLCVTRAIADLYRQAVARLEVTAMLDRKAERLFSGGDDLFSWTAASVGRGFGIFPELRVLHLISATRLTRHYFLRLVEDHAFSAAVLHYLLARVEPQRTHWSRSLSLLPHGARNGYFSMMCRRAAFRGQDRAARYVAERQLQPVNLTSSLEDAR